MQFIENEKNYWIPQISVHAGYTVWVGTLLRRKLIPCMKYIISDHHRDFQAFCSNLLRYGWHRCHACQTVDPTSICDYLNTYRKSLSIKTITGIDSNFWEVICKIIAYPYFLFVSNEDQQSGQNQDTILNPCFFAEHQPATTWWFLIGNPAPKSPGFHGSPVETLNPMDTKFIILLLLSWRKHTAAAGNLWCQISP